MPFRHDPAVDDLAGGIIEAASAGLPHLVGLAGPVSVGKTVLARAVADHIASAGMPVEVLGTDVFLLPNAVLDAQGLGGRKGFPETFDRPRMEQTLARLRAGGAARVPVYSHATYDIVPGVEANIEGEAVIIVEGVNALQEPALGHLRSSVYLDAAEPLVRRWFVERFFALRESGRADPASFYASMAALDDETLRGLAVGVWEAINLPNLIEHIEPTRARAAWVVTKGADHAVVEIARGTR